MELRHQAALAELLADREPPFISLYQPTHRSFPENQQDPIRFRNLVKTLDDALRRDDPGHSHHPRLTEPLHKLAEDVPFWKHNRDGLAVFAAKDFLRVIRLQRSVAELAVVCQTFHTKPLVPILQTADRYHVLALTRKGCRLFEGSRDALDELPLAPEASRLIAEAVRDEPAEKHQGVASRGAGGSVHFGGRSKKDEVDADVQHFFRAVDRAILDHHSRPAGLPLLLVSLAENQGPFHAVSHNPHLLEGGIDINPEAISAGDLRERAWKAFEPRYQARVAKLVDDFGKANANSHGTDDLATAAQAAVAGRVATLLLEDNRQMPGRIDFATGAILFDHPRVDDLLDDLAEVVLKKGGEVVVLPADRMPSKTGAAATFRF
jgi:hypothetical protein